MEKQIEKDIVERVIKKLVSKGVVTVTDSPVHTDSLAIKPADKDMTAVENEPVMLEPSDAIRVENPNNPEALKIMRKTSPARLMMGRCGARQRTSSLLNFMADHAAAVDAVFKDVSDEFLETHNLFKVKTVVRDKDEYLMKPDLGKQLGEAAKREIIEKGEMGKQVQIIVVDGLSSTSIEANIPDVMPAVIQGLKVEGVSVGRPFFVKYGRVGVMDEIAPLLKCDVIVEFIGERPGLITAESMSAYMAYRPGSHTVEAERTVVSNIHRGGTPPAEAGAHLATVLTQMLKHKAGGVRLSELLK